MINQLVPQEITSCSKFYCSKSQDNLFENLTTTKTCILIKFFDQRRSPLKSLLVKNSDLVKKF